MKANKKVLAIVAVIALVAILGICLVACNADSYRKKLEDKGYVVGKYEADKEDEGKIEWGITATNVTESRTVTIIKYANEDDAKARETSMKENNIFKRTIKRSGKILFFGSEKGVEDAM